MSIEWPLAHNGPKADLQNGFRYDRCVVIRDITGMSPSRPEVFSQVGSRIFFLFSSGDPLRSNAFR